MADTAMNRDEIQKLYFTYTKNPWIYPVIIVVIGLVDLLLITLYYYFTFVQQVDSSIAVLLMVHAALFGGILVLRKRSSPQTRNISPVLFLVIPGMGGLIYSISYIVLYFVGMKLVQQEFKHAYAEESEMKYEKKETVDFAQVAKLMDMSGVFTYSDAINKKGVIVDLLSADVVQNCRTLKQGLEDEDPEVVHYTATTLNYLENRFEQAIRDGRDKAAEELTKENLENLITLYENYVDSGLLDDDIIPIYRKKVIEILELQVQTFGSDLSIVKHLAYSYMEQGRADETCELLKEVAKNNPEDVGIQFTLMSCFYKQGDLPQVKNLARIISRMGSKLTKEQSERLAFWIQDETETSEEAAGQTL